MVAAVLNKAWPVKARGATIQFTSMFFDAYSNIKQPAAAQVRVTYTAVVGGTTTLLLPMTQVPAGGPWVAQWDSRGAAVGVVYWSVEAPGNPPVSVEDGQLTLSANLANAPNF